MPSVDFEPIPSFVRIKSVYMRQFWPSIAQHLLPLIKQFSGNFINSLNVRLNASIGLDYNLFGGTFRSFGELFASPVGLMSCLHVMLGVFEQCSPQFTFCLDINDEYQRIDTLPLIASILELPLVEASDNVHFLIPTIILRRHYNDDNDAYRVKQSRLFDVISDWLHRPYVSGTPPVGHMRSLEIGSAKNGQRLSISEDNVEQLIDHLKVVCIYFLFVNILMFVSYILKFYTANAES